MASVAALYTPEVLMLATGLTAWPLEDGLTIRGDARSASCGSTLGVGLALDADGRIARIGMAAQACAVGQAAAAIMAGAAVGRDANDFAAAERALVAWLADGGDMPDWPGLAAIAPARDFPGRHGAILLGWRAVIAALSSYAAGR
ncbi:iron-sulfur cluster assembly scaffold protein [Novosphingobium sp. FSY-8]|uniref:Iron-sulfur cluster assembly scaffold protein n=1 Tax=Novosphingobium ovatum TaxID=1908523 RepID=A0ABW9XCN8_9SPHN|nr:iron-sulfur cluster assembly scaffold protein [Novosphingobium ovatum]NBC36270.1 iron-sulfur cluster assembly scaffold protein [Novosphingobium ovatum]